MRHLLYTLRPYFSTLHRKQNFFELPAIYPDPGQKQFDLYNGEVKKIPVADILERNIGRDQLKVDKLIETFIRKKFKNKTSNKKQVIDKETGLTFGLQDSYDDFIIEFKRKRKIGLDTYSEYGNAIKKFIADNNMMSELEVIKFYRFTLAHEKMKEMKGAVWRKVRKQWRKSRKALEMKEKEKSEKLEQKDIEDEVVVQMKTNNDGQMPQLLNTIIQQSSERLLGRQLDYSQFQEALFQTILNQLDWKIAQVQAAIRADSMVSHRTKLPSYHPVYGTPIRQQLQLNTKYDLNTKLGIPASYITSEPIESLDDIQDQFIRQKITKQFYANQFKATVENPSPAQKIIKDNQLPLHIRHNDKIINELAFKYKELGLVVEPDVDDIANEMQIALQLPDVPLTADPVANKDHWTDQRDGIPPIKLNHLDRSKYLWQSLSLQQVFYAGEHHEDNLKDVDLAEKDIESLSPHSRVEMSLNKLPFNLHRHQDLEVFGVFQKERRKILKEVIEDASIERESAFEYFSLEQSQRRYNKVKKEASQKRFEGKAIRKSSRAEAKIILNGTGKVSINNKSLEDYFGDVYYRGEALKALLITGNAGMVDVDLWVTGGGSQAQAECLATALADAFVKMNPQYRRNLYMFGLIGTDNRKKQPKKMGLYSARKRPPYVRR